MPECVILITINYRLGLLGFLNPDNENLGLPGNNDLKDQVMALKWIQENIKAFGGDPNNVMIIGESAGGVSVHLHLLSKQSRGLFHKAISMSGFAELPWAQGINNNLEMLGVGMEDAGEVWRKLKGFSKDEIMEFQKHVPLIMPINKKFKTRPGIEPKSPNSFLTDRPLHIINSGDYNKVPFITGYTDRDGLVGDIINRCDFGVPLLITDFEMMVPQNINKTGLDLKEVGQEIMRFYFGTEEPTLGNLPKTVDMVTGACFFSAIPFVVKAHARTQRENVYLYRFTADTGLNYLKRMFHETANYKGAAHTEDLAYLFNNEFTPKIKPGSIEDVAIDTTVKLFTNFAKYGNPSNNWLPVTEEIVNYMDIGIHAVPGVTPDREAYEFWETFYDKYL